jgi:anti-anti-sigma factor
MNFTFEKSGTVGYLPLHGELTVQRADCVREALMMTLNNTDFLVVDFTNVTSLDPFCLQLFCMAYNASLKSGKHLMLTGVRPGIFKPKPNGPGLNCVLSCGADNFCTGGWASLQAGCECRGLSSPALADVCDANIVAALTAGHYMQSYL